MLEVYARETDWIHTDEEALAAFLETPTGKRLLPKLTEVMPKLLGAGDTNAVLIRSGEVRAYQEVISTIISLAHPSEIPKGDSQTSKNYPNPEDDAAWNDGQNLITPNP
jgi:hypothetical protein